MLMYTGIEITEKSSMQHDGFRFLGSLNYCLKKQVTEVVMLFLSSALSYGIVSQFISELPRLYLFLSILLKLFCSLAFNIH